MNKEFWDARYSSLEYVYGEEPNVFFREQLTNFTPGKILLPAEGEGRNAVHAARSGWEVHAFDQSIEGQRKAQRLAQKHHVSIDYQVGEFNAILYEKQTFDLVALIYAHFPASVRTEYHRRLTDYLKPGGGVILEVFSKKHHANQQANPRAGGPKDLSMLYTIDDIREDFPHFEYIVLKEEEISLSEGMFHEGKATVIRFVGRKI